MISVRRVQPELLDNLPEDAPSARRSRRDLRILNRLIGNEGWFRSVLASRRLPGERVLEIGAGEGDLARALMERGGGRVAGLDLTRRPADWPREATWFQTSVFDFVSWPDYPVVIGGLVFHHFNADQLADLGAQIGRHARLFVASEPLRSRRATWLLSALCPLINADPVTRHDGHVSIRAGFRARELPTLLKLDPAEWSWEIRETLRGAYRMVAERRV